MVQEFDHLSSTSCISDTFSVASFPGPAQLSIACSFDFSFTCRESLGTRGYCGRWRLQSKMKTDRLYSYNELGYRPSYYSRFRAAPSWYCTYINFQDCTTTEENLIRVLFALVEWCMWESQHVRALDTDWWSSDMLLLCTCIELGWQYFPLM